MESISVVDINSNIGTNEGNAKGNQESSVFYEYLFDHGFIGFLAWIILWTFIFKKPTRGSRAARRVAVDPLVDSF